MTTSPLIPSVAPLLTRVSPELGPELARYVVRHRAEVEAMIRTGGREAGLPAARRYAKVFDGLLGALFGAVEATMRQSGEWQPVALAAVGSYGRGAVAFASDLDVRLLPAGGVLEAAQPIAEALLYPLWDTGLSVGHQVVSPDEVIELGRTDLPTATSLLDWRHVAGARDASARLLERVFEGLFGIGELGAFIRRLGDRADDRRNRFGGSVYLLEPDVKNGPGGIRDLDVAHWAARARWRITELADLVRLGVLVPREWQRIDQAHEFHWRVRNLLHAHGGRRTDRLSFDRQEQIAEDLGYGSSGPSVERFMSDYYRHARAIEHARDMILSRALPPPTKKPHAAGIGRGLTLVNGEVSIAHPGALETEPALAFRLFDEALRRDVPVYEFARDLVARAASSPTFAERLRASDEAARLFVRLVMPVQSSRLKHESVLAELHDVGLLVAMIPEFSPVVGRVHHDVYHVYTVDAHSVAAVDRLRSLGRGDLAGEYPLASRLAAEIARPRVLFFATLLHDVGKDIGGKNHSERGAQMAPAILQRLGFPEAEISEIRHLVAQHLRMYHVATRRDIDDPATLDDFCRDVHGSEGLRELYLLTVSDVSTTSPTAMTSWKARMLDELYVGALRRLGEGSEPERAHEELVASIVAGWDDASTRPFFLHFLEAMPLRYLHANSPEDIRAHARFALGAADRAHTVDLLASDEPHHQLGFVSDDRPGLLAIFTATLAAARLPVVGAQIYSWCDPAGRVRALDLFWVKSGRDSQETRGMLARIERDLARLLAGLVTPAALVSGGRAVPRYQVDHTPHVATEVSVDHRATAHTVIEVTTRDRPGLLFWLANTVQEVGLAISLAKINTEGTRVADVFYVTDASGAKLVDPARIEELKRRILSTVAQLEDLEAR
ncbi:MAG: [protein-PII] uridylyltransferase [Polyangiaceae bacterium]|nr:[protein-PII] uridylyltransferase [Polyangiaceae bacterium]